jgi:DNA-binding MarR family transcriptional regulator
VVTRATAIEAAFYLRFGQLQLRRTERRRRRAVVAVGDVHHMVRRYLGTSLRSTSASALTPTSWRRLESHLHTTGLSQLSMLTNRDRCARWRVRFDCDASMATSLVDRLEEKGLVERRTPLNRRVKTIVLTPLGIKTKERLSAAFYEPPDALMALDTIALQALLNELRKLSAPQPEGGCRHVRHGGDAIAAVNGDDQLALVVGATGLLRDSHNTDQT